MMNLNGNIGFISADSPIKARNFCSIHDTRLKVATLYYDHLILPFRQEQIASAAKYYMVDEKTITSSWISIEDVSLETSWHIEMGNLLDGKYQISLWTKGKIKKGLRRYFDEAIAEEVELGSYDFRNRSESELNADSGLGTTIGFSALASAILWTKVRAHIQCAFVAFNGLELIVAKRICAQGSMNSSDNFLQTVEAYVPSIRELPWSEVFALREDSRVKAFRNWLSNQVPKLKSNNEYSLKLAVEQLWAAVEEIKPNARGEIIKGICSNFPMPILVNPLGVGFALKSIYDSRKFEKKFEWLLFMHSLREKSKRQ